MDNNLNLQTNNETINEKKKLNSFHKTLVIFQLIFEILHFIPAFFIFGTGLIIDFFLLLGASKNYNENLLEVIRAFLLDL